MGIVAVWGSPFEKTLKVMCNDIMQAKSVMMNYVKEKIGFEPHLIDSIYHCGIVCKFIPVFDFYIDDIRKIDGRILRKDRKTKQWVPNMRTSEGKKFYREFDNLATLESVTDKPLHEYGLSMADENQCTYYKIIPYYDAELHTYYMECSDDIMESFGDDIKYNQMIFV